MSELIDSFGGEIGATTVGPAARQQQTTIGNTCGSHFQPGEGASRGLVGAFSMITNLRMDLRLQLY